MKVKEKQNNVAVEIHISLMASIKETCSPFREHASSTDSVKEKGYHLPSVLFLLFNKITSETTTITET